MKLIDNIQKSLYKFVMGGAPMDVIYDKDTEEYNEQLENEIWYRGNATELNSFYSQFSSVDVKFNYFWSKSYPYTHIRKIHSGLPAMIIDKLVQITIRDGYNITATKSGVEYKDENQEDVRLQEILTDNNFENLLKFAVASALVNPKGAYKISADPEVTKYPILEFVPSKNVEVVKVRNRTQEIIFKNYYEKKSKEYCLYERYQVGQIAYELYEVKNNELALVPLDSIEETMEFAKYEGGINKLKTPTIYAVEVEVYESSIFSKKKDVFDAIDEVLSIMGDSVRDSRTERYIPKDMLPVSARTGEALMPDGFDSRYIATENRGTEDKGTIQTVQPDIKFDGYTGTLKNYVDQALLGVLSPTTLGLDNSNGDRNAEDRREQEKTSIFTRTDIIRSIENIIQELCEKLLQASDEMSNKIGQAYDISVEFGEYASLTFEDRIDIMAVAKRDKVLPDSVIIDELYGDTKSDEEKEKIVQELAKSNINIDFGDMLPKE